MTKYTAHDLRTLLQARILQEQDKQENASPTVYAAGKAEGMLNTLLWFDSVLKGEQDEPIGRELAELGVTPQTTTTYTAGELARSLRRLRDQYEREYAAAAASKRAIMGSGWIEYGKANAYDHAAEMILGMRDCQIAALLAEEPR